MDVSAMLDLADDLGLAYNGDTELIGTVDGALVRLDVDDFRVAVRVPATDFPESIRLRDLPPHLRTELPRTADLDRGWLVGRCSAQRRALAEVARAAGAVAGWWREPARVLVEVYGMTTDDRLSRFEGAVDGVRVEVVEAADGRSAPVTWIRGVLPRSLPDGVRIRRPGRALEPTPLPDLILGDRIHIEGPLAPAALCCDAVRGPLLGVLYDHGGHVDERTVHARIRGLRDVTRVHRALRDVVDLARGLAAA